MKHLLLVEDEIIIAMYETKQLTSYDYEVTHVTSGKSAIEYISANNDPVDLVLMDIDLGEGMDGTEAAKEILQIKDIPIVFLSSHEEPEIVEKTEQITSYGYVVKSSKITVLDASIKMAFRLFHEKQLVQEHRQDLARANEELEQANEELIQTNEQLAESNRIIEARETELAKSEEFLNRTGKMASVGGWEVNLQDNTVYWSDVTKIIHEVPIDYVPTLDEAVSFFPGVSGTKITEAVGQAIKTGKEYELILDFVTAKGKPLIVKTIGNAVFKNGKCLRLYGTFQDVTNEKKFEKQKASETEQYRILAELHSMFALHSGALFDFIIEASKKLTGSKFSFFGIMNEDETEMSIHAWSKNASEACAVRDQPIHFSISESGIWGDCVRERKTVIYNNYSDDIPTKHGTPEGHVPITRYMGIPIFEGDRIVAVGAVANKDDPYEDHDAKAFGIILSHLWDMIMRHNAESSLHNIQWLLSRSIKDKSRIDDAYSPPYGDVTELNTWRTIMDSIDRPLLQSIAANSIDMLDTSVAIYEKNGDYAFGMFSSGWCRLMDISSWKLCNTDDNARALSCGKWLCHENCWNDSAKKAMRTGKSTDIKCVGGIHLYAEPIFAGGEVVGAINIGYGDPPSDDKILRELSDKFNVDIDTLTATSQEYRSRPQYMIDIAKKQLKSSALLIGKLVESSLYQHNLNERLKELQCLHDLAVIIEQNKSIEDILIKVPFILKEAMTYPSSTEVRISYDNVDYTTYNFKDSQHKITSEIVVKDNIKGFIDIAYTGSLSKNGKNVFIKEEQRLLNLVAERLGRVIERITIQKDYVNLLEMANEAFIFADSQGIIRASNMAAVELCGYDSLDKFIGISMNSLYTDADSRTELLKKLENERGEFKNFNFSLKRKDGSTIHTSCNIRLVKDAAGNLIGTIGAIRDISENKRIEKALRESEKRFKALHDASFGGIAIHNNEVILDCNQGLSDITGFSFDELIGMDLLLVIAPDSRNFVMDKIRSKYEEPYQAEGIRKDGSIYPLRIHTKNISFGEGDVSVVELRDITDFKNMEKTIRDQLQEKQILLKDLNHRIKNSFNMIIGLVNLNLDKIKDNDALSVMNDITTRIHTISQLYSLLHKDSYSDNIDLSAYFEQIAGIIKTGYINKKEQINISLQCDPIKADIKIASSLGLVLTETLTNSLKYAFPGNRKGEIVIKCWANNNELILHISDNGIGLPKDFDIKQSKGLGMMIIHGMVKQIHGELVIESNKGIRFIIKVRNK